MTEKEREVLESRCHFHSSSSSSFLLYHLLHPSVRFRSRQLGVFRPTLDIVFAASRVELSARDFFRAATRRLIILQCPSPSLRDRDVTKLARIRSRIQLVSYVPFYIIRIN